MKNLELLLRIQAKASEAVNREPLSAVEFAATLDSIDKLLRERLERDLAEARDLLRSACCIAERKGARTNWERFIVSVNELGLNGVTARTYRLLDGDQP